MVNSFINLNAVANVIAAITTQMQLKKIEEQVPIIWIRYNPDACHINGKLCDICIHNICVTCAKGSSNQDWNNNQLCRKYRTDSNNERTFLLSALIWFVFKQPTKFGDFFDVRETN